MVDSDKLAAELIEVQSQLAFQEDTVAALNEALARQQHEILRLQQQLAVLKQRQDEQLAAVAEIAAADDDEKPPHY